MKILSFLLLVCSLSASADPKGFYFERFQNRHRRPTWEEAETRVAVYPQTLNPTDPKDDRKFDQRYYVNSSYAAGKDSPVLYYLCGEATCRESSFSGAMSTYAKELKAHMIAIEHRFYGKSQPFPTLSTENLKYLSTDLALADAASFQRYAQTALGFTGKWIVVGGSYAGSLAAYYRLKFPELAVGALASSGPVQARANFEEYDHHVAVVAGPECLASIKKAVAQLEGTLGQPEALAALKKKFAAEALVEDLDFVYLVADMAALAVQYGYRDHFCELLKGEDPMEGYAKFTHEIYLSWGINALSGSAQGAVSLDPADYEADFGTRQWFYQSCTEYGYWQNAYHDEAGSARSKLVNPAYHNELCRRLYGIETPVDTNHINYTFYAPLLDATVTNIFFPNGSRDPWMNLSIAEENGNATNPNTTAVTIPGAAHCDDLRAAKLTDSAEMKAARTTFLDLAKGWLK